VSAKESISQTEENEESREDDAEADPPAESGDDERAEKKPAKEPLTIWQRATYRWTAITALMAALLVLYTQHPYYEGGQFNQWRSVYPVAFMGWLLFGLFYCKATLEKFKERRYVMRDGGLHLVMLAKHGLKDVLTKTQWMVVAALGLVGGGLVIAQKLVTNKKASLYEPLHERGVMTVIIVCGLIGSLLLARCIQGRALWRKVKNPRVRTTLLGICVKGFFTPLMTGFVSGHLTSFSKAWLTHKHLPALDFKPPPGTNLLEQAHLWWVQIGSRLGDLVPTGSDFAGLTSHWSNDDISFALGLAYDFVFIVDCGWALAGYASESRWLGNKTRSVEPTALGWVACIFCYPPFNGVLGTYLPLENGPARITDPAIMLWFRAFTVLLFAIYSSATVAFGWKFSNLTNRGIVMRGPYRYIRHPAYVCKCSAWWLEHIPTMTLTKAFFLTLLCGVYALRAWTEERHLSRDPDYREYKKKTPWVIIPGVY
jgi:protein-S-isoprenylcysteine O-methyltransferase Ste14